MENNIIEEKRPRGRPRVENKEEYKKRETTRKRRYNTGLGIKNFRKKYEDLKLRTNEQGIIKDFIEEMKLITEDFESWKDDVII